MIKSPQEYIKSHFNRFSTPVCSRFKQLFEQISNEETQLSKKIKIKNEQNGKKNDNYKIDVEKPKSLIPLSILKNPKYLMQTYKKN